MSPPPPPRPEKGRKKSYKGQVDVNRARRRRESQLIQLRKLRREETISKKRREEADPRPPEPAPATPDSDPPSPPDNSDSNNLQDKIKGLWSENSSLQLEATIYLKKLLSIDGSCPIEEIIKFVPRLVKLLSSHKLPQLQLEAAWALTNITAGTSEQTEIVINSGAVSKFIELLGSPRNDVREQVMWALGNIAADSEKHRNLIIDNNGLMKLLSQFNENIKISNLRIATWTLSNLCFGKIESKSQIKDIINILGQLLNSIDEKIVSDACWALYYICINEIELVINSGICNKLVKLLMHSSIKVVNPVILSVTSISAGDDAQVQLLIKSGLIPCLSRILRQNDQNTLKKRALMTISNICAGTTTQVQVVVDAKIFSDIIYLSQNGEMDLKREAFWAISNAVSSSSPEQIRYLVGEGCIKPLCDALVIEEPDILYSCLNALERILETGEMERDKSSPNSNPYSLLIEQCEGLYNLENLQMFDNEVIYDKTIDLLEGYFNEEEEEGSEEGETEKIPSKDD